MEIIIDNLRVIENGSLVIKKDSTVNFRLDADHLFTLEFSSQDNNNPPSLERGALDENHMVLKCVNFGGMGASHGLVKPFRVLNLSDGGHLFLQFSVSGSGISSRILHYTWFTEVDSDDKGNESNNPSELTEVEA